MVENVKEKYFNNTFLSINVFMNTRKNNIILLFFLN